MQKGVKSDEVVSVVVPVAQAKILDEDVVSLARGRKPFLESPRSFSRSVRMSRVSLVAWVRLGSLQQLRDDKSLSRRQIVAS